MNANNEQTERTERTTVSLPASLASRVSYEARRSNRSVSAIVREALAVYLASFPTSDVPSFVGIAQGGNRRPVAARVDEEIERIMLAKLPEVMGRKPSTAKGKRTRSA